MAKLQQSVFVLLLTASLTIPAMGMTTTPKNAPLSTWLYVGGSGPGNYTTIQQAINDSTDGDTIYVYHDASPYQEHLTIMHSLALQGENKDTTLIDGNSTGTIITVTAPNVTIQGFTLQHSGDDWSNPAGIRIQADTATLSDLLIQQNRLGIRLSASSHSLVTDCTFRYNDVAIYLEDNSSSNRIACNSIVSSSFEHQIAVLSCTDNTLETNTISNSDGFGIYVNDSLRTRLLNNTLTACEDGIVIGNSNHSQITGNTLQNSTVVGISMGPCTDCQITNNTFRHDGLFVYQCYGNAMTGNTVNGRPLIYLELTSDQIITQDAGQIILINCTRITVQQSSVHDTTVAVQCWNCRDCVITKNNLTACLSSLTLNDCTHTTVSSNTMSDSRWEIFFHVLEVTACQDTTVTDNDFSFSDSLSGVYLADSTTLLVSKNTFHGTFDKVYSRLSCGYSRDVTIADNVLDCGSIGLAVCSNVVIKGNTLEDGSIALDNGALTRVVKNDVHPQPGDCGIILRETALTTVRDNTITVGTGAVSLSQCLCVSIRGNSFIDCGDEPASFTNCLQTTWSHNYWGQAMLNPKIIHGLIEFTIGSFPGYHVVKIPVINIDMFPKQIP